MTHLFNNQEIETEPTILVTGANGTIGSQLTPQLLQRGYRVRAMVRDPQSLACFPWKDQVDVCPADVFHVDTLKAALRGIKTAYYLIHSMMAGADFEQHDRTAAIQFSQAALAGGVQRIIYLGALGDARQANFSPHLQSRQEIGHVLRACGLPVIEFRAGIITGPGSLSFEMIRSLAERIPFMICPRWVFQRTQPIHMGDVIRYLVEALETPVSRPLIVEIGGQEVLTYGELMLGYARQRGLRRWLIPVPVLTPRLSSYWVHWTTPIPAAMARPLIEGLRSEVMVCEHTAEKLFPQISCRDYKTAVDETLDQLHPDAFNDVVQAALSGDRMKLSRFERGMIVEVWQSTVEAPADKVYQTVTRVGGSYGWGRYHWLWWLRGWMDRCVGGIGFRREGSQGQPLGLDDHIDFFRVDRIVPNERLRLKVDMKLPGQGWLEFQIHPLSQHRTQLVQNVYFAPRGLWGLVYWYGLQPIHRAIFASLLKEFRYRAEQNHVTD